MYKMSLLILLLLLLPSIVQPMAVAPNNSSSAGGAYETLEIVPSKQRRSAQPGSKIAIGTWSRGAEILELRFPKQTVKVEVTDDGQVLAQSRHFAVRQNALDIKMVLDPLTRRPLTLPADTGRPVSTNEYKFLIRGHYNQLYICMNASAVVYTMRTQNKRLPEDCLWRGLIIPKTMISHDEVLHKIRFYHAFYPENFTASSDDTRRFRRRWLLGFRAGNTRPAPISELGSPRRVEFILSDYVNNDEAPVTASAEIVQIGDKNIGISDATLSQAVKEHVARLTTPEDCAQAAKSLREHREARKTRLSGVLVKLQQLQQVFRSRGQRAGVSIDTLTRGEKALKQYLKHLPYHFLLNRGKCVREEIIVAFQSVAVADMLEDASSSHVNCQSIRRKSVRRRLHHSFRESQEGIKTFFKSLNESDSRNRPVLDLFREELNISLPGIRVIQEAMLWRRVKKLARQKLLKTGGFRGMESEARKTLLKAKLEKEQDDDAAQFILTALNAKTAKFFGGQEGRAGGKMKRRHQERPLVSKPQYQEVKERHKNFPLFYFDMKCSPS